MVVARASGMDLASILKRNTFLTLGVRPAGVRAARAGRGDREGPRDGGTQKGPGTGGHGRAPAGGGHPPYIRSPGAGGWRGGHPPTNGHPMRPARMTWGVGGVTGVETLGG